MPVPGAIGYPILQKLMQLYDENVSGGTKTQVDNFLNSLNAIPPVGAGVGMAGMVLRPGNLGKIADEARFIKAAELPEFNNPRIADAVSFLMAKYPKLAKMAQEKTGINAADFWSSLSQRNASQSAKMMGDIYGEGTGQRVGDTTKAAYDKFIRLMDDQFLRKAGINIPIGELDNPTKVRDFTEVLRK